MFGPNPHAADASTRVFGMGLLLKYDDRQQFAPEANSVD